METTDQRNARELARMLAYQQRMREMVRDEAREDWIDLGLVAFAFTVAALLGYAVLAVA